MISGLITVVAIGALWLVAGAAEAKNEFWVKFCGTIALLLVFPFVYLWKLFRLGPWFRRNAAVLLIFCGIITVLAGVGTIALGFVQISSPSILPESPNPQAQIQPPKLQRQYSSPAAKARLEDDLDELSRNLSEKGRKAANDARALAAFFSPPPNFDPKNFEANEKRGGELKQSLIDLHRSIWANLLNRGDTAEDIKDVVREEANFLDFQKTAQEIVGAISAVNAVHERTNKDFNVTAAAYGIGTQQYKKYLQATADFERWIALCMERIGNKRQAINE